MIRTAFASLLLSLLVACGGGATSAPAPATSGGDEAAPPDEPATCCCDYIAESGSEEDGTWAENQTYEMLSSADCADLSGSCTDEASCAAGE